MVVLAFVLMEWFEILMVVLVFEILMVVLVFEV